MRRNAWLGFGAGAALVSVLFGCGGAGGSDPIGGGSGGSGGSGGGGALQEQGTARVDVNAETGVVKVTPLGAPTPGSNQPKSMYTGSAITVTSSALFTDASELTMKKLKLTVKNNTADDIQGARLIIDKISSDSGGSLDLREFTNVATIVGPGTTTGDGPGPTVTITNPNGIARDTDGSVYIAGFGDGTMRRLKDGFVSRIATGLTAPGGVDVLPGSGFVFAVEQSGHRLVRVPTAGGAKYVLAGSGAAGLTDGTGAAAQFSAPRDMVILDSAAYIADFDNDRIRKVTNLSGANGVVTTLAVSPAIVSPAGIGTVSLAGVDWLAVVSTTTHKVFLVNSVNGQSFQIGGTGVPGFLDGPGNTAQFSSPSDIVSVGGNLYVCELNNKRIRQISLTEGADPKNAANWVVKTIAGTGASGTTDGQGTNSLFTTPRHIAADGSGALLVTDINVNRIRKVTPASGVFPVTGGGGSGAGTVQAIGGDGYIPSTSSSRKPYYLLADALEPKGSSLDNAQEELTFTIPGEVKSFYFIVSVVGSPSSSAAAFDGVLNSSSPLRGSANVNVRTIAGQDITGWVDGPSTLARFRDQTFVGTSDIGHFVSDALNSTIRFVDLNGKVSTIAGLPGVTGAGFIAGSGSTCSFSGPAGIWSNAEGTEVFVADFSAAIVARLSRSIAFPPDKPNSWSVTLVAGSPASSGNIVGSGSATRFFDPIDVAASADGRIVFVADRANNCIKQLSFMGSDESNPDHWRSTFYAGSTAGVGGYLDDVGDAARFQGPNGITVSTSGDVFVGEFNGYRIRKISPSRVVTLLAGSTAGSFGDADGDGPAARFQSCFGLATDNAGFVYVADGPIVRRVDINNGRTTTVAGVSAFFGYEDGPGNTVLMKSYSVSYSPRHGLVLSGGAQVRLIERIVRNGAP